MNDNVFVRTFQELGFKKYRKFFIPAVAVALIVNANISNKLNTEKTGVITVDVLEENDAISSCFEWKKRFKEGEKMDNGFILSEADCWNQKYRRRVIGYLEKEKLIKDYGEYSFEYIEYPKRRPTKASKIKLDKCYNYRDKLKAKYGKGDRDFYYIHFRCEMKFEPIMKFILTRIEIDKKIYFRY